MGFCFCNFIGMFMGKKGRLFLYWGVKSMSALSKTKALEEKTQSIYQNIKLYKNHCYGLALERKWFSL